MSNGNMRAGIIMLGLCLAVTFCASSDGETGKDLAQTEVLEISESQDLAVSPPDMSADDFAELPPSPSCTVRPLVEMTENFFVDVSFESGMQTDNYLVDIQSKVPINDHSRLAFADINSDGWDDIVAHSLYPNPVANLPFEHLVFLNQKDGTFLDFSDESGLRDIQAGFFAFGDVDNDGDQDCFAGLDIFLMGESSVLLLNDGSGHFQVREDSGLISLPSAAANAVFADFDSDGDLDLFVGLGHTSSASPDKLYLNDGEGYFTDVSSRLELNPVHPTNGSTTCDYDNDGDLDILVSTYGVSVGLGLNILWQNDGMGNFTNQSVETGFASLPTGNYFLASTGYGTDSEPGQWPGSWMGSNGFGIDCDDLNNDGLMDVFLTAISHPVDSDYKRKWSDPTQVLYNLGKDSNYGFENRFLQLGLPFNEGDVDGAAVDYDNDGLMDLSISRDKKYEKNYQTDQQKAWFGLMKQRPDHSFESMGLVSGINKLDSAYSASLIECTTDEVCPEGEACLFDRCRQPCSSSAECTEEHERCVWLWNDNLGQAQSFCKPLLRMKKAQNHVWSDIDHDGDLDLLVGGRDTGGGRPNFLFRNDLGHQNRWLAIQVAGDGININRDAIGTRLEIRTEDQTLVNEVKSSRGMYSSIDTRTQHFGLGRTSCDYELAVRWPDGTKVSFTAGSFPEETYLRLTYPDQLEIME